MLRDILNRNPKVMPPAMARVMRSDFYDELPIENRSNFNQPQLSRDQSLFVQLRRGMIQPENKPRFLDFDRTDRITTEQHGVKVRLGEKTVDDLIGEKDKNGNIVRTTLGDIKRSIDGASVAQIHALGNAVGIPINDSINLMKDEIMTGLNTIFEHGLEPNIKQQRQILAVLQDIQQQSVKPQASSSSSSYSIPPAPPLTPPKNPQAAPQKPPPAPQKQAQAPLDESKIDFKKIGKKKDRAGWLNMATQYTIDVPQGTLIANIVRLIWASDKVPTKIKSELITGHVTP